MNSGAKGLDCIAHALKTNFTMLNHKINKYKSKVRYENGSKNVASGFQK
jgi:hypothetical protein